MVYIYTVSHKCEYTPHISAINWLYLFKGQYYRNNTWIYFRVVNVQLAQLAVKIYCPLKRSQNTAVIVKQAGNKMEYTLSENWIHGLTRQSHMSYSSCPCFVCLTGPYTFVYLVLEQFKLGSLSTILSYWPLDVQHGTSWQRTLWGFKN